MTRGYWQVPLDEESVPISAFVTPFGHFQWRYMPFGLRNAPATLSRIVVKLLRSLDDFSGAYLDDIINISPTWTAHAVHYFISVEWVVTVYTGHSPLSFVVNGQPQSEAPS